MESKSTIKNTTVSWIVPWITGFLFTSGFVGTDPLIETYSVSKQVFIWIVSYLFWPLILGEHLRLQ